MSIVKGEIRSMENDYSCECAGSLNLKIQDYDWNRVRDQPVYSGSVSTYFGTLIIRVFKFHMHERVYLSTENGFAGIVRVKSFEVTDEGRSFIVRIASDGVPDRRPPE